MVPRQETLRPFAYYVLDKLETGHMWAPGSMKGCDDLQKII